MPFDPTDTAKSVKRAQADDADAFNDLVRRFQDMAVAYAATWLGDWDLAQDVAQEAFVEAYRDLPSIREPGAFPAWLRKIVFKHCDRITRGKRPASVSIADATDYPDTSPGLADAMIRKEVSLAVREALTVLSGGEQEMVLLFYVNQYSHKEISEFLSVSEQAVKSRLHAIRGRLKRRLLTMIHNDLQQVRPSLDGQFITRIQIQITGASAEFAAGDLNEKGVRSVHPFSRYRGAHPVKTLSNLILQWTLEAGEAEAHIVPDEEGVGVWLGGGDRMRLATVLPKNIHGALTDRYKDVANLMGELGRSHDPGTFAVTWQGREFDVLLALTEGAAGDTVAIRFIPKERGW